MYTYRHILSTLEAALEYSVFLYYYCIFHAPMSPKRKISDDSNVSGSVIAARRENTTI
jgi:hypothetical protein